MATSGPLILIWLLLAPCTLIYSMDAPPRLYSESGLKKEIKKAHKQGYEKAMQDSCQIVTSLDGQLRAHIELNKELVCKLQAAELKSLEAEEKIQAAQEQILKLMAAHGTQQIYSSLQDVLKILRDSSDQSTSDKSK